MLSRRSFIQGSGALVASLLAAGAVPLGIPALADTAPTASVGYDHLDIDLIRQASQVLADVALRTPLHPLAFEVPGGAQVFLKLENLQHTGAFKLRGAYFMIASLSEEDRARGVATCSAGNHAQGVGYASREFGVAATIFIPEVAPLEKIERTRSYGVDVQIVPGGFTEAKAAAERFVEETGCIYVPPYDDYTIMAGQGTIGVEIVEQMPDVDVVIVPVGGGGLISGVSCAVKSLKPDVRVYGIEPAVLPSMSTSLASREPVTVEGEESIADGLDVARPGDKTFGVVSEYVDEVFTVEEDQIADAIFQLAREEKVVAEGAGAVGVAALMNGIVPVAEGERAVVVVSGGNMDMGLLANIIDA